MTVNDLFGLLSSDTTLKRPSVGKTPSGHLKIHVEMAPADIVHLLGYDPRHIAPSRTKRPTKAPGNVANVVVDLQRDVQRSIDQTRVDAMVAYLHNAVSEGAIADWAEIDVVTSAKADLSRYESEHVVYMPTSAAYFITDGQHRFCALLDFVKAYPSEARQFTQPVAITLVGEHELTVYAGQSFHDKNYLRAAVKVAKALATDTRDPVNRLAKDLAQHPVILEAGGVDTTRDTPTPKSPYFTTHGVLYKFVRAFVVGRKGLDKGDLDISADDVEASRPDLWLYVNALGQCFPTWADKEAREGFLFRTSSAVQALGVIGHDLWTVAESNDERAPMLARISERKLDWRKVNRADWEGVIGHEGKEGQIVAQSSRPAIDATIALLRRKSGLAARMREAQEDVPVMDSEA